jgi:hypothetical protein
MIDPFVLLAPILVLGLLALVRFIGCAPILGLSQTIGPVTFNPPPGYYVDSQNVTVSVEGGVDSISYTINGSAPQPYNGFIPVTGNSTITVHVAKGSVSGDEPPVTYVIGRIALQEAAFFNDPVGSTAVETATTRAFASPLKPFNLMVVCIWYQDPTNGTIHVRSVTDSTGGANFYQPAVGPTTEAGSGYRQETWYAPIASVDTGGMPFSVSANFTAPFVGEKGIIARAYLGADAFAPLDTPKDAADAVSSSGPFNTSFGTQPLATTNARLVFAAAFVLTGTPTVPASNARDVIPVGGNLTWDIDVVLRGESVQVSVVNLANSPWILQVTAFK